MQRGRVLIVVAGVIAATALLFPFFTAQTVGTVRSGQQLLPFAALVVVSLVAMSGDRGERLTGLPAIAATAAVAGAAFVSSAAFIDAIIAKRNAADLGFEATIGTGLWLTAIAVILAAVGSAVAMSRRLS
ncbi:MAG: hypothetical protein HKN91_14900 [Acidimicrobiia bacterium]|nr:hypothetical protein [Acidimicrobiia bacterium]